MTDNPFAGAGEEKPGLAAAAEGAGRLVVVVLRRANCTRDGYGNEQEP